MSIIDDFYRRKEIINLIQAWQPNMLEVTINTERDVVQIGFCSGIRERLTKDERWSLLQMIQEELVPTCQQSGDLSRELTKKLHAKLKEIKDQVRKDFNLEEVKT